MTTSPPPQPPPAGELHLTRLAAEQLSYHARMAAVFAVAGQSQESAAEAVLAWTILATQWPEAQESAGRTAAELVGDGVAALSDADRDAAHVRAAGLALDVESHYVSVGLHAEATFYARLAEDIGHAIASLTPNRGGGAPT